MSSMSMSTMTDIFRWFFGVKRSVPQLLELEAKLKDELHTLERQGQEQYYIAGRAYSEDDKKVVKAALRKKNQIIAEHIRLTGYLKNVEDTRREREAQQGKPQLQPQPAPKAPGSETSSQVIPTIVIHPPPADSPVPSVTDSVDKLVDDLVASCKQEELTRLYEEYEKYEEDSDSNSNDKAASAVVVDIDTIQKLSDEDETNQNEDDDCRVAISGQETQAQDCLSNSNKLSSFR